MQGYSSVGRAPRLQRGGPWIEARCPYLSLRGSPSRVERLAVNQKVVGSNPTPAAVGDRLGAGLLVLAQATLVRIQLPQLAPVAKRTKAPAFEAGTWGFKSSLEHLAAPASAKVQQTVTRPRQPIGSKVSPFGPVPKQVPQALEDRLTVGQLNLSQPIGVRIPILQPVRARAPTVKAYKLAQFRQSTGLLTRGAGVRGPPGSPTAIVTPLGGIAVT